MSSITIVSNTYSYIFIDNIIIKPMDKTPRSINLNNLTTSEIKYLYTLSLQNTIQVNSDDSLLLKTLAATPKNLLGEDGKILSEFLPTNNSNIDNDVLLNITSIRDIVEGDENAVIITNLGQEFPSLKNVFKQIYEKGGKFYPTLVTANLDIANISTSTFVITGDSGTYYKATTNATSLTKSPYDVLTTTQAYSDTNIAKQQQTVYNNEDVIKKLGQGVAVAAQFLTNSNLEKVDSVALNASYTVKKDAIVLVNTASVLNTSTTKQDLTATVNGVSSILAQKLRARDTISNGLLKTKFSKPLLLTSNEISNAETVNSTMMRANFLASATPNLDFSSPNSVVVYSDRITAASQTLAATMTDDYCIFGHTSGYVSINIKNTYLTSLGYALTTAGIKKWFSDVFKSMFIEYYSTIETTYPCLPSVNVKKDDVVLVSLSGTLTADVYSKADAVATATNEPAYTEFKCDVDNNSAYSFTNYPIELKANFDQALVLSSNELLVEDQNGIQYAAQFEQARNNNVRKEGRIGKFVDGSLRTGSIWISDTIAANTKKDYVLKLKKQSTVTTPTLNKITGGYSITINGYVYTFNESQSFLLSAVRVLTATKAYLTSAVCREVNAANSAFNTLNFTLEPEIKLISSGAVFSEIEVTVYNQAGERLAAKDLKLTVTYMLFTNGKMRVKTLLSATKDIAKNTLSGYTLYHQLNIGGGTRSNAYGSALLTAEEASLASPISVVMTIANGDIHRDGQDYGPSRPTTAVFSASTANTRTSMGWDTSSIGGTTLVNYGVPKNWTWTTEIWVNFNETQTTAEKCSQACVNRPVGFFGKTINKYFTSNLIVQKMIQNMRGYYNAVTAPETAVVGGISKDQKTNYHYPTLYDLTETTLLGKSITEVWDNFVEYMNRNYKPVGQTEIDLKSFYLDGRMSSQYIWYRVLCPIQYFYKFAQKENNQSIQDICKLWIGQYCEAVVQTVDSVGWFPLTPSILSPAANANSTGIWALGLAIYMGLDTSGIYTTTFNTLTNLVTNSTGNGRWLPVIMDTMDSTDNIAKQRWARYEGIIAYMFNEGHLLANKTPIVDFTNNFMRFSNGDGNLCLIDASRSESRRGAFQEPIEVLHLCMRKNTKSSLNLAYAIAKNYEFHAPYDLLKTNRMYDCLDINSSWNDTVKQVDSFSFLFCKPILDSLL